MKKLIILAIIITLLIPAFTLAGRKHNENDVLMNMLKDLNVEFLEGDLNMGGIILDEFLSLDDMDIIAQRAKDTLGVLGEEINLNEDIMDLDGEYYFKEYVYTDDYNQISIYGYDSYKNPVTIMVSSYYSPEYNNGETTLFINLIKMEKIFDINGIIESVEGVFMDFNKPVDITTCVIGTIQGRFDENTMERTILKTIKKSKGKIVEEYVDSSIISYMIYTPYIEKFISSGIKKVNLNLAIRYNEYEDRTYIWIGTPIITTGY